MLRETVEQLLYSSQVIIINKIILPNALRCFFFVSLAVRLGDQHSHAFATSNCFNLLAGCFWS
jgi:hypothetical protein